MTTKQTRDLHEQTDRRTMLAALGAALGALAVSGCENEPGKLTSDESLQKIVGALLSAGTAVTWVDSIAGAGTNLQSAPTSPVTSVVVVGGYLVPGDGGGGPFYWDASSTVAANGGTIVGAGSSGRWFRIYSGDVNVQWFGATPGADATASFQAAITYCTANKRALYVPTGTYLISGTLTLDLLSGFRMYGDVGRQSGSHLQYTASCGSLITFKSSDSIIFERLQFSTNAAGYSGDLLWGEHLNASSPDVAYITFTECKFFGEQSYPTANSLLHLNQAIICTVERCLFSTALVGVLGVTSDSRNANGFANAVMISESTFTGCEIAGIFNPGEAWSINNCTFETDFEDGPCGISTDGTRYSYGLAVTGCWFGDTGNVPSSKSWIKLYAVSATITGSLFAPLGNNATGACVEVLAGSSGIVISGNDLGGAIAVKLPSGPNFALGVVIEGNSIPAGTVTGDYVLGLNCIGNTAVQNRIADGLTVAGEGQPSSTRGVYLGILGTLPTNVNVAGAAYLALESGALPNGSLGLLPSGYTAQTAEVVTMSRDGSGALSPSFRVGPNNALGFYGAAPIAKPTITGSKGGNAALTSLISQLASLGLITDSTT